MNLTLPLSSQGAYARFPSCSWQQPLQFRSSLPQRAVLHPSSFSLRLRASRFSAGGECGEAILFPIRLLLFSFIRYSAHPVSFPAISSTGFPIRTPSREGHKDKEQLYMYSPSSLLLFFRTLYLFACFALRPANGGRLPSQIRRPTALADLVLTPALFAAPPEPTHCQTEARARRRGHEAQSDPLKSLAALARLPLALALLSSLFIPP
jgi:hypothetical protein